MQIPMEPETPKALSDPLYSSYITFFENYPQILKYNKPSLKFFDKDYYHLFQSLVKNPMEIYKQDIFKKISFHFKIYTFWEYLNLLNNMDETASQPVFDKKLDKIDLSIFITIIRKILLILMKNIKDMKKNMGNDQITRLLQLFPLIDERSYGEGKKLNIGEYPETNLYIIELSDICEVLCFILPIFPDEKNRFDKYHFPMEPITIDKMNENFNVLLQNPEVLEHVSDIETIIPSPLIRLFKNFHMNIEIEDISEEIEGLEVLKNILYCYLTDKEYILKKITWNVDMYFILEYLALSQLSKFIKFFQNLFKIQLKPHKKSVYDEMTMKKLNISPFIVSTPNKESYKQVLKNSSYVSLLMLEWIGNDEFIDTLMLNEFNTTSEKGILLNCFDFTEKEEKRTPLSFFYAFLCRLQSETDETEIYSKYSFLKCFGHESRFRAFNEKYKNEDIEKFIIEFISSHLSEFFKNEFDAQFTQEPIVSSEKGHNNNIYSIVLKKMVIKYESSIYKDSYMDVKDFILLIEFNNIPGNIVFKMKLPDFQMTIENGDELLYFTQVIASKFPEIVLDIDETRRVIIKMLMFYSQETPIFSKIIENIDYLIVLAINFYIVCIRSMYYYKPTKDTEKYDVFINILKEKTQLYKKETQFFTKWDKIKGIYHKSE